MHAFLCSYAALQVMYQPFTPRVQFLFQLFRDPLYNNFARLETILEPLFALKVHESGGSAYVTAMRHINVPVHVLLESLRDSAIPHPTEGEETLHSLYCIE